MKGIINFFSLNLDNPIIYAKFGQMFQSFFSAIREHGWEVLYSNDKPSTRADILVVPMGGGQEYKSLKAIQNFAGPVILIVYPALDCFDEYLLSRISRRVLFAYGTDCSSFTEKMYAQAGITYYCLPFASDPAVMKPLHLPYQYDVVFVGSLEHAARRNTFLQPLIKALTNRPFMCIGTGWQQYGIPEQVIAWGPLLNTIYNLGRVCINIHTKSQVQGKELQLDLNNRVFDLALAGCCQVCDNPEAVRTCFNKDEVAATENPKEWVELVLHMLSHPLDVEAYRKKALFRALKDHSWHKRAGDFVRMIEKSDRGRCWGQIGDIKPHSGILCAEAIRQIKNKLKPLRNVLR